MLLKGMDLEIVSSVTGPSVEKILSYENFLILSP